jgi:hypothetical protein
VVIGSPGAAIVGRTVCDFQIVQMGGLQDLY